MNKLLMIAAMMVATNAMALPNECERLTPADAAVLTAQQLHDRYCAAKRAADGMSMGGVPSRNRDFMACMEAVGNISHLAKEKGSPNYDCTK